MQVALVDTNEVISLDSKTVEIQFFYILTFEFFNRIKMSLS